MISMNSFSLGIVNLNSEENIVLLYGFVTMAIFVVIYYVYYVITYFLYGKNIHYHYLLNLMQNMKKIAILYGTSSGNTESVANRLKDKFDGGADMFDVGEVSIDEIQPYQYLILGTSTTGMGDLQDDWESFLPTFSSEMDFSGNAEWFSIA